MMRLFNTLSRKIEKIEPLNNKELKIYTCGLTVYSQPQIGNWVAYIYADVLTRVLKESDYKVNRVQNITDVGHLVSDNDDGEDKMEKGARKEGLSAWDVAKKYIRIADDEAYSKLSLLKPDKIVRATELIPEQIQLVKILEEKGLTYKIPNEGIYFDTSKLKSYGRLARLDVDGLKEGARVNINGKKNPTDFALWKFSPRNRKRDMEWDSPWGIGFPGWHLECSVIAMQSLGEQIDIHTGGIDHIPVHHTNEIAQSESATGKQFVKYWFHNNHIKINDEKLSKSKGNSYTLTDLIKKGYSLDAFKLMVLTSHYRTEGNFTWEILDAAQNLFNKWQRNVDKTWQLDKDNKLDKYAGKILSALQNDLNTPEAVKIIDEYFDSLDEGKAPSKEIVSFLERIFGIKLKRDDIDSKVKSLIKKRQQARLEKNWELADGIREELRQKGIGLNDYQEMQIWYWI